MEISKEVLEKARERGFEHLDGPYFKRKAVYYVYDPSHETMSISREEDYQEFLREKEGVEREAVREVVQETQKKEPSKTVEPEILTDIQGPTDETVLQAMELADEKQIAEEVKGRVIEQYFYSFQIGRREVIGLSYAGTKQVAREMARRGEPLDVEELIKEESDTHWTVTARVVDRNTKEHRFGIGRQAKLMTYKDGSKGEDEFALTKAVSKAQRNGLRAFIPESIIVEMYREWKKQREERERF